MSDPAEVSLTEEPPPQAPPTQAPQARAAPSLAVWAAAAALLSLPLIYLPDAHHVYALPKATVFRAAVVLMLLAGFMRLLGKDAGRPVLRAPELLLLGFLGWVALAASVSGWAPVALLGTSPRYEGALGFVGYAAFFWTASRASLVQAKLLLRSIALSGALLGLAALLEMLGPFRPPGFGAFGLRATSPMGNPVFLGAWTALAIPTTLAGMCLTRRRAELALAGVALGLQTAGLYLSAGRGAWLGAVVGLAVAGALLLLVRLGAREREGRGGARTHGAILPRRLLVGASAAAVILLAVLALTTALSPGVAESGTRLTEAFDTVAQGEGGGSAETRLVMWRATLDLVAEHPLLGAGPETFLGEFPRVRPLRLVQLESAAAYPDRPHNHWLYLAYATGLPGLALYVGFLLTVVFLAIRSLFRSPHPSWQRTAATCALLGGAAAYEVQAVFSFSLVWTTPAAMTLLGLLLALMRHGEVVTTFRVPTWAARVGGIALLALALALLSPAVRDPWADREFRRAVHDPAAVVEATSRAVSLSPRDAEYVIGYGRALEQAAGERGDSSLLSRAILTYEDAERRIPHHPDMLFSMARVQAQRSQFQAAIRTYERVLSRDRFHTGALFNLAAINLEMGDAAGAEPLAARILSYDEADAGAWYLLGRAHQAQGRPSEARGAYERALTLDPAFRDAESALKSLGD